MKVKLIALFAVCGFALWAVTSYQSVWQQAEELAGQGRPVSAAKAVEQAYTRAMAAMEYAPALKSLLLQAQYRCEQDEDSVLTYLHRVQAFARTCPDTAVAAVAYSYGAEGYQQYYDSQRWLIDGRTPVVGQVPADERDWTSNMFADSIRAGYRCSLAESQVLYACPASSLRDLLTPGKDSLLCPTLYDLLVHRAVAAEVLYASEVREVYGDLHRRHLRAGREDAALRVELDSLSFEQADLDTFIATHRHHPMVVYAVYLKTEGCRSRQAYDLCQQYIALFPQHPYTDALRHRLQEIRYQSLVWDAPDKVHLDHPFQVNLGYANIDSVHVRIYRFTGNAREWADYRYRAIPKDKEELYAAYDLALPADADFQQRDTTFQWQLNRPGCYRYEVWPDTMQHTVWSVGRMEVSRYCLFARMEQNQLRVYAVDLYSGKPVAKLPLQLYEGESYRLHAQTDKQGFCVLPVQTEKSYQVYAVQGEDVYTTASAYSSRPYQVGVHPQLALYADRSLFRPGQTVHFKGILYALSDSASHLLSGQEVRLRLRDSHAKVLQELHLITNEWGSVSGSVQLPREGLPGQYTLEAEQGYLHFQVEQYKRPTFEVRVQALNNPLQAVDSLQLQIQAVDYTGMPQAGALAVVRLSRRQTLLRKAAKYGWGEGRCTYLRTDTLRCDAEGRCFYCYTPEAYHGESALCWEVQVAVTNAAGETQTRPCTLFQTSEQRPWKAILPAYINREQPDSMYVRAYRTPEQPLTLYGRYKVRLNHKLLEEGDFVTNRAIAFKSLAKWPVGRLQMEFQVPNAQGTLEADTCSFILFSPMESKFPVDTVCFIRALQSTWQKGKEAAFLLASSYQTYALCELYDNDCCVARKSLAVGGKNLLVTVPTRYYKLYPRLQVRFLLVYQGKVYQQTEELQRSPSETSLELELHSFRRYSYPDTQETWELQVYDAEQWTTEAEVLAALYDISLDAYQPHSWIPPSTRYVPTNTYTPWNYDRIGRLGGSQQFQVTDVKAYCFEYPALFSFSLLGRRYQFNHPMLLASGAVSKAAMHDRTDAVAEENSAEETSIPQTVLRKQEAETVFFEPHLHCGEDGNLRYTFTTPQALGSYKLQVLAYDKKLHFGYVSDTLTVRKSLQVQPLWPRFVRRGDVLHLTAQVQHMVHLSDSVLVRWELRLPQDDRLLASFADSLSLPDSLPALSRWRVNVPDDTDLLRVVVYAEGKQASDGEEYYLPVLSDKVFVTETVPFRIDTVGNYRFCLPESFSYEGKRAETKVLRMEYAVHPTWYALQAYPSLVQGDKRQSLPQAITLFAASKAQAILQAQPAWQRYLNTLRQGSMAVTQSVWEKNDDLRELAWRETPWVLYAETEQQRMAALAENLTPARLEKVKEDALERLRALQLPSGAFVWWEGGTASVWMTLQVLDLLQGANAGVDMQEKAIQYLRNELKDEKLREAPLSTEHIYALSLCYDAHDAACQFYLKQLQKNWMKFGLDARLQAARIAEKIGDKTWLSHIRLSLQEYLVYQPGVGSFWRGNLSIAVHARLLEAFADWGVPREQLNRLQQWLLSHKQTQVWSDVLGTVYAVSALSRMAGEAELAAMPRMQWGADTLRMSPAEYGSGYLSYAKQSGSLTEQDACLHIQSSVSASSWGALYWQYLEELSQVPATTDTALSLEKQLFRKEGNQLYPYQEGAPLHIGDEVVTRLVLRADRDLSFVCVKDLRAAGLEPGIVESSRQFKSGLTYYQINRDASMEFFIEQLPQGSYVLEYSQRAQWAGQYAESFATAQCLYSPEFFARTAGTVISIE